MGEHTFSTDLDPAKYGLSCEIIALEGSEASPTPLRNYPAVGVNFSEVSALLDGAVLLTFGMRLPDNHIFRSGGCRVQADVARTLAAALLRAADLSQSVASNDRSLEGRAPEPSSPHARPAGGSGEAR